MNDANTQKLYADFPSLYRGATTKIRMHSGFGCGDGWFRLVYKLSADIEAEARKLKLDPESAEWPMTLQVKEKFGTLKFYCEIERSIDMTLENAGTLMSFRPLPSIESIRELILKAEEDSATICEKCGQPGTMHQGSYWHVACATCEAGYEAARKLKRKIMREINKEWKEK
jgi:hypothetical protein